MKTLFQTLLLGSLAVSGSLAGEMKNLQGDGPKGFAWESPLPEDCPFEKSTSLTGIFFTGRHSDYQCGDTGRALRIVFARGWAPETGGTSADYGRTIPLAATPLNATTR